MTTRRNVLKAVPAALAATAMPAAALAGAEDDRELRRLWSDYITAAASLTATRAIYHDARAAYDAEVAPDGITPAIAMSDIYCMDALWEERVEPAFVAFNEADKRCRAIIAAIRATAAEGLAGVAIKVLAQLPNGDGDMEYVIESLDVVRADIARLANLAMPDLS